MTAGRMEERLSELAASNPITVPMKTFGVSMVVRAFTIRTMRFRMVSV
jgi:hypothetical protein